VPAGISGGMRFGGDPDTGLFSNASNTVFMTTGGYSMSWTSTVVSVWAESFICKDTKRISHGDGGGIGDTRRQGEASDISGAESAPVTVFSVQMVNGESTSFIVEYRIRASDGTDTNLEVGRVRFNLVDESGGVTGEIESDTALITETSGTLTESTWTLDTTDDGSIEVKVASSSTLTQTEHTCVWIAEWSLGGGVTGKDIDLTVP